MKCPHCNMGLYTRNFRSLWAFRDPESPDAVRQLAVDYCPVCEKAIVLLRKGRGKRIQDWYGHPSFELKYKAEEELLFPRHSLAEIDGEVPDPYKKDLAEAVSVLQLSPKASAALSRRLLQATLREKFGIRRRSLALEIDAFLQNKDVPTGLADEIDAIRSVGNFAAHPIKDTNTGEIVEVEPGEAQWLVDVLYELFDFAFVKPKRRTERKKRLNEKQRAAGKPPLKE